jgi:hypothetical protein
MPTQSNIVKDLSTLSQIPLKVLAEIHKKEALCIGSAIHDAVLAKEDIAILNIGIGTLSIEISSGQCKFLPSKELKQTIKRSLEEKVDPVEMYLEKEIIDKLLLACEEVL